MPELSIPDWPLERHLAAARPGAAGRPGVILQARTQIALADLMPFQNGLEGVRDRLRERYALDLPGPRRRAAGNGIACAWAGPARWLVELDLRASHADPLVEMERSLGSLAAVVRQTDGRSVLRISGSGTRDVLRKGSALDLHPRSFRTGDTAIGPVAGIDAHLWQVDDSPTYDIVISRSVTGSFWEWLVSAAAEFGMECRASGPGVPAQTMQEPG